MQKGTVYKPHCNSFSRYYHRFRILAQTIYKRSWIFPTGYTIHHSDCIDGYGGVFIACHDALISQMIHSTESSCELVACHIQHDNHSSFVVCSIYCSPSSGKLYLAELCLQLKLIKNKYLNSAFWIGGHVNLTDIDSSANSIQSHHYTLSSNNNFLNFSSTNMWPDLRKSNIMTHTIIFSIKHYKNLVQ